MPSATAPGVDPARQLGFIVAWSALNLLACAGFALLVVFGLHARRRNAVLLSFETVFALATGSNALLTWTGAVGSVPTPSGLCLASAALTGAFAVAQGAAACTMVVKAWAHIMLAGHPQSAPFLRLSSSVLLAALPWIAGTPPLVAVVIIGLRAPSTIVRTSPMYCTCTRTASTLLVVICALTFEVVALVLAAWTAFIIGSTHRRARAQSHSLDTAGSGQEYYPLVVRTLVFALLLLAAFGANISSAFTSYSNPIPDIITSSVFFLALFVFGSDPSYVRMVQKHRTISSAASTGTPAIFSNISFARPASQDGDIELKGARIRDACPTSVGKARSWEPDSSISDT